MNRYAENDNSASRTSLSLPETEDIVMYTGHLYDGKGANVLVEAAGDIDAEVFVIGGTADDSERLKTAVTSPNVTVTGFVEPSRIPSYQNCADILVAPYTWEASPFVCPLKIFEYMATGNPMVVSKLPAITEVLTDEENALLAEPEDSTQLSESINKLLHNKKLRETISKNALDCAGKYKWEKRAADVLSAIR